MSFRFAKPSRSGIATGAHAHDVILRAECDAHRGLAARALHGRGRQ